MTEEYRTIAAGSGWWDRSARGRIRFAGPDAARFLQALLSNDVQRLGRGEGVYATYLTPQGRMIADLDVLHRGDALMALVADGLGASLAARFDHLIFSEAVTVTDVSDEWMEVGIAGRDAAQQLGAALAVAPAELEALPERFQLDAGPAFVMRAGEAPVPMFVVVAPAGERPRLLSQFEKAGIVPVSRALAEVLRVEAGRAAWGADLTAETIPLEAGLLERAISTNKGCYVGQEIIIRILHRGGGRVAKRLAVLDVHPADGAVPPPGAALERRGQAVGHLTSSIFSPGRGRPLALGYVQRDASDVGEVLQVAGTSMTAAVVGFAG